MQTRVVDVILVRQGKVKDSGWGSDDEAAALPEAEAAPAPAPKQTARKQVASAFDLLQGSDGDPGEVASAADDGSDAEMNGAASEPDSAAHSDSDSDLGQQVMRCQFACIQHLPHWQRFVPVVYCNTMQVCLSKSVHWLFGNRCALPLGQCPWLTYNCSSSL